MFLGCMIPAGMVNNHPTYFSNEGHAGWTSLVPRLLPSHMRPKSWERAGNKAKTGNQNYSHACICYEEYGIYTNSLFLLLV